MSEYVSILEVLDRDGQLPEAPEGLELALKGVGPDWKTYNGFQWGFPGQWTESPDEFNPATCAKGGLHVARTILAAQSGGAHYMNMLVVAYDPQEAGPWSADKRKVRRALTLKPVDLISAIRRYGASTDLSGANLSGADLYRANLSSANLSGADLSGADLYRANLSSANLYGADLSGADLSGADLSGADLSGADLYRANLSSANLYRANLPGANLSGADLSGADLSGALLPEGFQR